MSILLNFQSEVCLSSYSRKDDSNVVVAAAVGFLSGLRGNCAILVDLHPVYVLN